MVSYVKNFSYTGAAQTFTAPYTGYYRVELWGANGGSDSGGRGGYVKGDIYLNKNNSLYIYTGQAGIQQDANVGQSATFNGGARSINFGGSGGGATDLRTASGSWDNAASLRSRIIVAGGGGACSEIRTEGQKGGCGGGLIGGTGEARPCCTTISTGGTQVSGSAFGIGGEGLNGNDWAGGGGGWYGGKGSGNSASSGQDGCASGGSSYISGHTGSVAVTSTTSSSPKSGCTTGTTNNACSISPYINPETNAGYTFTNTVMIDGAGYKWTNTKGALTAMPNPSGGNYASGVGHSGNGYARITYLGTSI